MLRVETGLGIEIKRVFVHEAMADPNPVRRRLHWLPNPKSVVLINRYTERQDHPCVRPSVCRGGAGKDLPALSVGQ